MSADFGIFLSLIIFLSLWATWTLGFRTGYIQSCDDTLRKMRDAADEAMDRHEKGQQNDK